MALLVFLALLLALTGHSNATYCVCKDGMSDSVLQKTLDYACGAGADCTGILQNGACFQPNTVKDHCSYAVNSYYQGKSQGPGTCDFSGTATISPTPPASVASTCVYQASPGTTSTGTGTPTATNPGIGTNTSPGMGTNTSPGMGTTPASGSTPNVFGTGTGLGPAGTGSINDNNAGMASPTEPTTTLLFLASLNLLFLAPFWL